MKKRIGTISLVLVLVIVAAISTSAQGVGLPSGGWWSPFQIQNVGDGQATVTYTAYQMQGGTESYVEQTEVLVDEGASVTYNPALAPNYPTGTRIGFAGTSDNHLPSGFVGGVEIASDQPLRAVVTVNNFESGGLGVAGGRASAYYQSVQEPGTLLNFPVMKHNYFGQTTFFYIQAAGENATINATYTCTGCPAAITGITIDAGRNYLLDPSAGGVPSGVLGSLTVQATSGQIAGVVIEAQHGGSSVVGTFALATKGFGPDDADTTIVAPTNKTKYYNATTGWQLQNTTGTAASAIVTFTISGVQPGTLGATAGITVGDQFATSFAVPANGSYLFSVGQGTYYDAVEVGGTKTLTEGLFFSGLVVSSQPLVATVNEAAGANRILYSAFGTSNATDELAAPAVKEAFYNQRTSLNVQNVGTSATTPSASYSCSDGNTYTVGAAQGVTSIEPGQAFNFFQLSNVARWGAVIIPEGNNCAVTVTASEPIVAVAQESITTGAQDIKNYEGFNLP